MGPVDESADIYYSAAEVYNLIIATLAEKQKADTLVPEEAERLIEAAMGILRDTTKPEADPASVESMIVEVSGELRSRFGGRLN